MIGVKLWWNHLERTSLTRTSFVFYSKFLSDGKKKKKKKVEGIRFPLGGGGRLEVGKMIYVATPFLG